ncbi:hypothetical protein [Microvirga terricola]|nr:hypothetical protein [Microvirga terricola]
MVTVLVGLVIGSFICLVAPPIIRVFKFPNQIKSLSKPSVILG